MIIDKNFVYLHIPKTGGTWMRHALRLLPTFEQEYAGHRIEVPHGHRHKPVFILVRNPWDIYVSAYTHFHHNFTKKINEFDPKARRSEVQQFLAQRFGGSFEAMLWHIESHGDFMSRNYERLNDEHVLQYEKGLASELFRFLEQLNVSVPEQIKKRIELMQGSRFNAHQHLRKGAYYTDSLEQLVATRDGYVVDFWRYSCPTELKLTSHN
jgi:hypothetical protein